MRTQRTTPTAAAPLRSAAANAAAIESRARTRTAPIARPTQTRRGDTWTGRGAAATRSAPGRGTEEEVTPGAAVAAAAVTWTSNSMVARRPIRRTPSPATPGGRIHRRTRSPA